MRVLFLTHDYLPAHPAGTEIHTAELARRLRERGVETAVFTTEKDVSRADRSLTRREYEGTPVFELVNNLFYDAFEETWDWPPAAEAFARVLDEVRPDVVHVMHLLYLSVGCVEEAARRGIPVVFTLHDFWLLCPRFGQLVHADGSICHQVDYGRCGSCLGGFSYAQGPLQRRVAGGLTALRRTTGIDLKGPARAVAARLGGNAGGGARDVAPEVVADYARRAEERVEALRRRLVPVVARFLAPSRFLLERMVSHGYDATLFEHVPNGIELDAFAGFERVPDPTGRVRVAFLGTLAPHKAPHVLLEAWGRLEPSLRARAELTLYGGGEHFPSYTRELAAQARAVGARLAGRLDRAEVPGAFARTDLLVVPSVWYENMPLTLLEARATHTPVIASDLGGLRELVLPGRSGWRFPPGDAGALAALLAARIEEGGGAEALDFEPAPVGTRDAARRMLTLYRELTGEEARP